MSAVATDILYSKCSLCLESILNNNNNNNNNNNKKKKKKKKKKKFIIRGSVTLF